jgi:hypothetical protein
MTTVTLTCVATCLFEDQVGPYLLMMTRQENSGFYFIQLTKETSDLVSPLYEHTVKIEEEEEIEVESENMKRLLVYCVGQSCYKVVARQCCRYRLDSQYKKKELIKILQDIVGKTFFLQMDYFHTSHQNDDRRLRPFFIEPNKKNFACFSYFNCENEQACNMLVGFLGILEIEREKKRRNRKSIYDNYWTSFLENYKDVVKKSVEELTAFTNKDSLYQKEDVALLFKNWKQYKRIAPYFTHQVLGMEITYMLHKFFEVPRAEWVPSISLLPLEQRGALYNCCVLLKELLVNPATDLSRLVNDKQLAPLLKGRLYHLFDHFVMLQTHNQPYDRPPLVLLLRGKVLVPLLRARLQEQAITRSSNNKATLDALTVQTIYLAYRALTNFDATSSSSLPIPDDHIFYLDTQEEEEEDDDQSPSSSLFESCLKDFEEIFKMLYQSLRIVRPPEWHLKEQTKAITAKSVIFFVCGDPTLLSVEETNADLYAKRMHGKVFATLREYAKTPLYNPDEWQQEWNSFKATTQGQQIQFILFTPEELKANQDLKCIQLMLSKNIFNSAIVCEERDYFYIKRLSHHIVDNTLLLDVNINHFHNDVCFKTNHFYNIDSKAERETVIVPQCHLLSLDAMKNLLSWLIMYRKKIKRIVLMGTTAMMASLSRGQAFLDLLQQANGPHRAQERALEFEVLLNKHWRYLAWYKKVEPSSKEMISFYGKEELFESQHYARLYELRNDSVLSLIVANHEKKRALAITASKKIKQTKPPHFYCLYRTKFGPVTNPLFEYLRSTFESIKNRHIKLTSLEIDHLMYHDATQPEHAYFIISRSTLLTLDKNQQLLLFSLVDSLYVIRDAEDDGTEKKEESLLDLLIERFRENKRPNLRYSYSVLLK